MDPSTTGRGRSGRAQAGVGTLILLVALLLIAAVAAGVFLEVSQVFQSQSSETGEDVRQQLTGELSVVAATGDVTTVGGTTGVSRVRLIVTAGGSGQRLAVDESLLVWAGPDGTYQLTAADDADNPATIDGEQFAYTAVRDEDDSAPIVNSRADRIALVVDPGTFGGSAVLEAGESVTVTIVSTTGSRTVVRLSVPTSISDGESVAL
ncbi:archaellin/type IV pilin N-terminal domain-containing protein [Halobaculum sp. MBLA0143]|uniref:archaellin/type IV pilin N-terminal domain-containing protein n=1 Tax=Halobaculum sp. MBLA0143 TaxID=3079933 RepID=UPI003523B10F